MSSLTLNGRAVKSLPPVTPVTKWLSEPWAPSPVVPAGLPGLALIATARGTAVYLVSFLGEPNKHGVLRVQGLRFTKADGTFHDLDFAAGSCTCGDSTFRQDRPGGCKHRQAGVALLAAIGVKPPSPSSRPHGSTGRMAKHDPDSYQDAMDSYPDDAA